MITFIVEPVLAATLRSVMLLVFGLARRMAQSLGPLRVEQARSLGGLMGREMISAGDDLGFALGAVVAKGASETAALLPFSSLILSSLAYSGEVKSECAGC